MNVAYLASGLTGLIPILAIGFVFYMRRRYSAPKFNGPALTGTAQILSLKTTASSEGNSGVPMQLCRLGVRVEVPGRGPYEVTVRHSFAPWAMPAVGSTVAVEVDSTDPSKVRLRVTGPMQRSPQARSFGSSQVLGDPANPVNADQSQPAANRRRPSCGIPAESGRWSSCPFGSRFARVGSAGTRGTQVVRRHRDYTPQPWQDPQQTGIDRRPALCSGRRTSVPESGSH